MLEPTIFLFIYQPHCGIVGHIHKGRGEETGGNERKKKKNTWAALFVDDSKLSGSIKKDEDMSDLQNCLNLMLGWMSTMGKTVNGDKSYTVRCGPVK